MSTEGDNNLPANSRLLLWDIDGTLLEIKKSKEDRHLKAINTVLNVEYSGISKTSGMTDLEIVKEIAKNNCRELSKKEIFYIFKDLDNQTIKELSDIPLKKNRCIIPALNAISLLKITNGILTGNSKTRAMIKIQSSGLLSYFNFNYAYFGDAAPNRIYLVQKCIESLGKYSDKKIIIVGDSPRDIEAAAKFGINVIAIATGKHSYEELLSFNPTLTLHDLKMDFDILINYLRDFAM